MFKNVKDWLWNDIKKTNTYITNCSGKKILAYWLEANFGGFSTHQIGCQNYGITPCSIKKHFRSTQKFESFRPLWWCALAVVRRISRLHIYSSTRRTKRHQNYPIWTLFWVIETKILIHVFVSITQNNVQIG